MADAPLATINLDIGKTLGRIKPMHAGFMTSKTPDLQPLQP